MEKSTIRINSRVNHKVFGDGTIIKTDEKITYVLFDDGEIKRFVKDALVLSDLLVIKDSCFNDIKISRIVVEKLFDRFDYDININTDNYVSILTAPNGCGKTTIFRFLDFIFNPQIKTFFEIKDIPFMSFSCVLSNGCTLEIKREKLEAPKKGTSKDRGPTKYNYAVSLLESECDFVFSIVTKDQKTKRVSFTETVIEDRKSGVHPTYYEDEYDYEDTRNLSGIRKGRYDSFCALINSVIIKHNCKANLDFIIANRLQKTYISQEARNAIAHGDYGYDRARFRESRRVDYLQIANDDMIENIKNWLGEYNNLSSVAKNRLPAMYINSKDSNEITFEQFKKRWDNYHHELDKFYELGILEQSEALINDDELEQAYSTKTSFLITYLDAYEGTLAPLKANYAKLKLFSDIFNKRNEITGKTIKFTPNGIEIYTGDKKIDINCLSSGEKNDFVMFYRLIFKTEKHGIVLIDEPEISLHIEWQEEYLDRLLDICNMNGLQAIIATHSPNIVSGHFELFADKR